MTDRTTKPARTAAPPVEPDGETSISLTREFILFVRDNRKWWLIPLIVMLLVMGLLILLSATPVAPFIYTLL